jgi:Uma2 family endonuclease
MLANRSLREIAEETIMATVPRTVTDQDQDIAYPTRDGRPMGETDLHRNKMADLIETLEDHFSGDPNIYVSGNLLVFYERGDRRKHVSPDVFVVRGVPKKPLRDHYLIWREGKAPEFVIEVTSKSTRGEDQKKKPILYRDVLKVAEYFLFDPTEDYLKPPFQGFRLVEGEYVPIEPVLGRLPSTVLGLHLERSGVDLRLFDPTTRRWLPTPRERAEAERERAEAERERAEAERERAEREKAERTRIEAEVIRLREENESLRRRLGKRS